MLVAAAYARQPSKQEEQAAQDDADDQEHNQEKRGVLGYGGVGIGHGVGVGVGVGVGHGQRLGGYGGAIQTGVAAAAGQAAGLGPDVAVEHGGPPYDIAFGKKHYLGPVSVKSKAGGYGKYVILKGVKHTVIPFVKTGLKYIPKKFYIYGQKHVAVPYYKKITSTVEHLGAGVGHASKVYTAYDEKKVPVIKAPKGPLKAWEIAPKAGHGW